MHSHTTIASRAVSLHSYFTSILSTQYSLSSHCSRDHPFAIQITYTPDRWHLHHWSKSRASNAFAVHYCHGQKDLWLPLKGCVPFVVVGLPVPSRAGNTWRKERERRSKEGQNGGEKKTEGVVPCYISRRMGWALGKKRQRGGSGEEERGQHLARYDASPPHTWRHHWVSSHHPQPPHHQRWDRVMPRQRLLRMTSWISSSSFPAVPCLPAHSGDTGSWGGQTHHTRSIYF